MTEKTIARLRKHGWAPAPWAHHPSTVKQLIREAGFRPQVKQCYTNCGRLMLACLSTEYEQDFLYCEGQFHRSEGVAVPHAWLRYRGELTDLTIVDGAGRYEQQLEMTARQFAARCSETGCFGPFLRLDPLVQEQLAALNAAFAAGRF